MASIDIDNFDNLSDRQKLEILIRQRDVIESLKKSRTVENQSGTFTKKIIRHGNKTRQKTDREYNKNNPEKVVLGYWGNIEFFCYPFTSTDIIRVRIGRVTTALDKYQINKGIALYNILKWAVNGGLEASIRGESNSKKADEIKKAYETAYKNMQNHNKKENKKPDKKSLIESLKEMANDKKG